jgi:uncharacterized membrane protein YhaH (DUF805 family)/RNA polymerase subunit RPABC4/transcription elongation factor Spt4
MSEARTKGQDEIFCFSCGEIIKQEAEICPKCGIRQKPYNQRQMAGKTEIYCHSCGERIRAEAEICPKCGVRQQQIPSNTAATRKKVGWSYFADAFKKYAIFAGRSRRAEFWWYALCTWVIQVFAGIISNLLFENAYFATVVALAFIVPSIAVYWRRMHDVGKPGGYCFIPIYDFILAIQAGETGSNQFGNDPKAGIK